MKIDIINRSGIWFDVEISGVLLRRCRLVDGPAGLPDLRVTHGVELQPHLFTAVRRRAADVKGYRS